MFDRAAPIVEALREVRDPIAPGAATEPMLSIVTVCYRARADLPGLLESIARHPPPGTAPQIVVVDNSPEPPYGVADLVPQSSSIVYLPMPANVGMGAGLNAGVKLTHGDGLLLVNPDLRFTGGALTAFASLPADRPTIVGPRLLNGDGSLQLSAGRFPNLLRLVAGQLRPRATRKYEPLPVDRPQSVDWVTGACLFIPRRAFDALGGFDERYFLYYEETDLCRRARRRGWKTVYDPRIVCEHLHPLQDRPVNPVVAGHIRDSRRLYFRTHCGPLESAALEWIDRFRGP